MTDDAAALAAEPGRCRYCTAAWPNAHFPCEHTEREQAVARQIAARIHENPTDEQVGWFMDDARIVCEVVHDAEPVVERWQQATMRLVVSGVRFRVDDEDGLVVSRRSPR